VGIQCQCPRLQAFYDKKHMEPIGMQAKTEWDPLSGLPNGSNKSFEKFQGTAYPYRRARFLGPRTIRAH